MQRPQRGFSLELFIFPISLDLLDNLKKAVSIDFTFAYIVVITTQKVIN